MWSEMYIGLHVKQPLFLSDFNESWIFSIDFLKTLNVKFHENRSNVRRALLADKRTDVTKLIIAFRNFVNAPNKVTKILGSKFFEVPLIWLLLRLR
jgi:hypothetical protein